MTCLSLETISLETVSLNEVTHKHRDNRCILFLDLQYNNLKVQNSYVDSLRLPVEGARITSLSLWAVTMTHYSLEQLGESLSSCLSLERIELNVVTCSEHRDGCCCLVLDLQKHNKLEALDLWGLSVEGLLLPVEGAIITSLELDNVTMTNHGLKQLGKSLTSCSSLERIEHNKVACIEHRDGCCCIGRDLQKHDKLE